MTSEWAEPAGAAANGADSNTPPGKILAAQREAMGWTVEQVADQLKLAVRQVVAIEAGDSAALPGPAVVRGFVRAYAKIVRLDPIPLVAKISLDDMGASEAANAHHTHVRHNKPASFSEVRFPSHGKRAALPIVPILAVLVLAGAAAAAWHFGLVAKLTNRGESTAASSSTVVAPIATAPASSTPLVGGTTATSASVAAPVPNLQNNSVPLISVPPPSSVTPGSASAGVAPVAAAVTPAAAPVATAAGADALVLTVREDSWIQVKPAKGAPLLARVVKAGSTETIDIKQPVTLVVGRPGAVSATLRGAAVELPVTGSAAARVSLK